MKIVAMHSHLNGHEWLLVHEKRIWKEIEEIIKTVDAAKHRTKISREKTKRGKNVFAPKEINKAFCESFRAADWHESRTSYWVTDDYELIRRTLQMSVEEQKAEIVSAGRKPIYSYNQTDFVKRRVAVEVQALSHTISS